MIPTVSTPATLTPVGYLQFESGVLGAEHSEEFANRTGINEVVKLSLNKRLELLLQTEPLVLADDRFQSISKPGDISAGLQLVLVDGGDRKPTLAVSYFRQLYSSPAPDLDIGSSRNSAILLFSFDYRGFHVDTNAMFNEQIQDLAHRAQFGQTLSIAHKLPRRWGLGGELWHFTQPFLHGHAAGFLFGPTYTPRPNLVFDIGFNRGLTTTSTRWEFFAGFTYLLPRKLW